jgi:predicted phosphodiesterase
VNYAGIAFIGDPHLASRVPGFRSDDYPRAVLEKLRWSLSYARQERLLPAILGDLFHYPRDNANWLLAELIAMLHEQEVLAIFGNHDYSDATLCEDDSFAVVDAAGVLWRVDRRPWSGEIAGRRVMVSGVSHGMEMPSRVERPTRDTLSILLTHHDLAIEGVDSGATDSAASISGVDLVVNGHIHQMMPEAVRGGTTYITPGNIARVNRTDAREGHQPALTRWMPTATRWQLDRVTVPHRPYEQVFHKAVVTDVPDVAPSSFVSGLAELQARATSGGEGLLEFLARNCRQFEPQVRAVIDELAQEVIHESQED